MVDRLIREDQLQVRVEELGREISTDYEGKDLVLVGILKGSVVFMADLMRSIASPLEIDFMAVKSYGLGKRESDGVVEIVKDLSDPIEGRHVLIVEDIIDSGYTLEYLTRNLATRGPASVRICTLLDKPDRRKVDIPVDYVGFTIEDKFVVGYGLDDSEKFRELPWIGVIQ